MLTLAGHIIGCLFWGALIAALLAGITAFIAKGISGKGLNVVLLGVLCVFLMWQTVLGTGALYAYSYVDDIHSYIQSIEHVQGSIDGEDAAEALAKEFPQIPENFIKSIADTKAHVGISMASEVAKSFKDSLWNYIVNRCLWALGFMTVGCFLLVKVPGSGGRSGGRRKGTGYKVPPRDKYADLY